MIKNPIEYVPWRSGIALTLLIVILSWPFPLVVGKNHLGVLDYVPSVTLLGVALAFGLSGISSRMLWERILGSIAVTFSLGIILLKIGDSL